MPKVSIIVPVYKVEMYLSRCVDSIISQTYTDWELLLIDDGSPDRSGTVCDEYAEKDARIRVFHKENGGVSSARNLGLDNVRGEWVTFVDADDALEPDTINKCITYSDGYDIVQFSMKSLFSEDGANCQVYQLEDCNNKVEYIKRLIARKTLMSVWGGFYRAFLFKNVRFDSSLISGEDWVVHLKVVNLADKIMFINEPLYLYTRFNENAATHQFKYTNSMSVMKALHAIKAIFPQRIYAKSFASAKCEQVYNFMSQCIKAPGSVSLEQYAEYINLSGGLRLKEILSSQCDAKITILLFLLENPVGKYVIRNRIVNSRRS